MSDKIEVRLTRESMSESAYLCKWPLKNLDALMANVKAWGVTQDDEMLTGECFGVFRIPPTGPVWFEICLDESA